MALFPRLAEVIVGLHKSYQFHGPVLGLGVQDTIIDYTQLLTLLKAAQVLVNETQEYRRTTNLTLIQSGYGQCVHASTFFEMMGLSPYADLDCFDYNRPALIHNLNNPVPEEWHNKYNLVFDGGCLEHVSNFSQGLENTLRLTKVGGHIIHVNPIDHCFNHGYFQFSPTLMRDFYTSNGCAFIDRYILAQAEDGWRTLTMRQVRSTQTKLKLAHNDRHYWCITLVKKEQETNTIQWPVQKSYQLPETAQDLIILRLKEALGIES